jgi:hypothetical protein
MPQPLYMPQQPQAPQPMQVAQVPQRMLVAQSL